MYYYQLAGLIFGVEGDWPQIASGRLRAYAVEPPADGACDVHCRIYQECDEIAMPDAVEDIEVNKRHFMKLKNGGFAIVDWMPEFSEKILNCIETNEDWSEVSFRLCREDFSGLDKNIRVFVGMGEILVYVLLMRGGGVLHASALLHRGQAVLFSAPSGTGKSTHTRLWKQFYPDSVIFNDDLPALRIFGEGADARLLAYGTPWAGKTQLNANASAPVRAVVFLKQAKENAIRRVGGAEAAVLLVHGIRRCALPELMQASLDMAARLLEIVPAYELSCTVSREAVDLVRGELFGEE